MKKILLFIIIIIFVSFSLLAEIKARVPVGFTSGRTHNIGFSTSRVSGSMEPDTKLETVTFSVSSDFSTRLSDGSDYIGYTNSGSNTSSFKRVEASSDSGETSLFKESEEDYRMPRMYNFEFNFSVPVDDIKSTSEYKGTITIGLETIG